MNNSEFTFEPLWTVDQTATFLGVCVDTLYAWRRREFGPPSYRIGAHIRYRPEAVRDWIIGQAMGMAG